MHRLTSSILDDSNSFQNNTFPSREIVCVIPTPYYLDLCERSFPNVTLNQYEGPFFLQCMNIIEGGNYLDENGIDFLMQWSQSLNIIKS